MRHPLYRWAEGKGLMVKDVVHGLGVSWVTLRSWDKRLTCPNPKRMKEIEALTLGNVTANDCVNYYMGEAND